MYFYYAVSLPSVLNFWRDRRTELPNAKRCIEILLEAEAGAFAASKSRNFNVIVPSSPPVPVPTAKKSGRSGCGKTAV